MENATKALIIAGSILVAILLIAVGMKVFNSTSGTTDSVKQTMSATEISTFNSKFFAYVGINKSIAQVKALANTIIANNATNKTKLVTFNNFSSANDIMSAIDLMIKNPLSSYEIKISTNQTTGLVETVSVGASTK